MNWYAAKDPLVSVLGIPRDDVHFLAGAVFAILCIALRPRAATAAWAVLFALELANEVGDALDWIAWTGGVNWPEMTKDIFVTLFLPTALLFIRRLRSGGD